MGRIVLLLAVTGALASATSASSGLQPVQRQFGERTVPLVRQGVVKAPAGHAQSHVRVIVTLRQAPLAAAYGRGLSVRSASGRLDLATGSSRAHLARLERAQRAAVATIRAEIPSATISRRFQVVLNGLTVELPARRLPDLAGMRFVEHIYPSVRYRLALNESPQLIGAPALWAATGARGDGVKIAVIDDGVDHTHPFFAPAGFAYPPGFPRGSTSYTTPRVIVARSFPGPGSGPRGRLPVDRRASFHGTHVAGIAAGNSGASSPGGRSHPPTANLSGVAPRAYIGNYRVFTVPTRIGHVGSTPEMVAAFEAAVRDGMDVINLSGGGAETEPARDALVAATRNAAAAGVVPVISAGNSRDEFGMGTVGAPGTAAEAVTVAAASNAHVFSPVLGVADARAPATLRQVPFRASVNYPAFIAWERADQLLADVGSIVGTDGRPVDRRLCGVRHPNAPDTTLPRRSLAGTIALVFRGGCAIVTKAARARAAGARGMVLVDNRAGEANGIPLLLPIAGGMVADLDGAGLRDFLASVGGRAAVRFNFNPLETKNGRPAIVTSFSSGGPTPFEHRLKPDIAAPGGEILSSTLPEFASTPYVPLDGTSMAAPHVAGAAALLVQRHPNWTPRQVKSALMSTAGSAWADTARTAEASVLLAGGGLVDVRAADDPQIFSDPASLSFGDLNVNRGPQRRTLLLSISDAGGGAGLWTVEVRPQGASAGASLSAPGIATLAPGGTVDLPVTAEATAEAAVGDDFGFVVLRRGAVTRRVPYAFFVTRPALELRPAARLRRTVTGQTVTGLSRVSAYRWPSAPFGHPPTYGGTPMVEEGAERLYLVPPPNRPVINLGVAVIVASRNSAIDPWVLGAPDENTVQGQAATPVNVNPLTFDYSLPVGAAGVVFPQRKPFWVAVDSSQDEYTGRSLRGRFRLRYWVNDVRPPTVTVLTRRVAAGRPTLVARVRDAGAGVNPLSLLIGYRRVLVGASLYDPVSGIAIFALPREAPTLLRGRTSALFIASDYQEAKNLDTSGRSLMPNTRFRQTRIRAVRGTTVTWLAPERGACVRGRTGLVVVAGSTRRITRVRFFAGGRRIGIDRRGVAGLYEATWRRPSGRRGRRILRAVVFTRGGRRIQAVRPVRVCR